MARDDFDLSALYDALDAQRRERGLTWAAATREINRFATEGHAMSASTITGLKSRPIVEGDGVLQILLWLGRSPESFVPSVPDSSSARFQLEPPGEGFILRWDTQALHAALDARRRDRGMTWKSVAEEIGGFSPAMLTRLAEPGRVMFPKVMRLVRWLAEPARSFTRIIRRGSPWRGWKEPYATL